MGFNQIFRLITKISGYGLLLLFILITGWFFYTASGADEKFNQMKDIIISIHSDCNINQQCPSAPDGWRKTSENSARNDRFIYRRGYYAIPDYNTNNPFNINVEGNEYFHITYIPFMDVGYHASGGKDVELLFWKHSENNSPVKLN